MTDNQAETQYESLSEEVQADVDEMEIQGMSLQAALRCTVVEDDGIW